MRSQQHLHGHDLVITLTLCSKFLNQTYGVRTVYVYRRSQYIPMLTHLPVFVRLVPKSVTLNDLERRNGPYFTLFYRIWSFETRIA